MIPDRALQGEKIAKNLSAGKKIVDIFCCPFDTYTVSVYLYSIFVATIMANSLGWHKSKGFCKPLQAYKRQEKFYKKVAEKLQTR